jgi:acetamidase/formamidase
MQKIIREQARKFAFDHSDKPILHVKPGERFEVETWDAGSGFFKSSADKAIPGNRPGFDRVPPLANPIAGPIFIEGLARGDTLVVNIHEYLLDSYRPQKGTLG